MKGKFRAYDPDTDFIKVRDFLVDSWRIAKGPFNWTFLRWEYARYFVLSLLGGGERIQRWESRIGLWEGQSGQLTGIVTDEGDKTPHVAWIFLDPADPSPFPEMFQYAEKTFGEREKGQLLLDLYIVKGNKALEDMAAEQGYVPDREHTGRYGEMDLSDPPKPVLPEGFRFVSMADENDVEKKRRVSGLGFDHPDPKDWPSAESKRSMQTAPSYRPELDLVVAESGGDWVSSATFWLSPDKLLGVLEPMSTRPEFRRQGLGKALVHEGARRLARLGAQVLSVGDCWDDAKYSYYSAAGFTLKQRVFKWSKKG